MSFDLKNFRLEHGYKSQTAFGQKVKYSNQPALSQMERGLKPVSDNLLMKIEEAFKVNLDQYKKKQRNKLGRYLPTPESASASDINPEHTANTSGIASIHSDEQNNELRKKYRGLIALRQSSDKLINDPDSNISSIEIAIENNLLLQELVLGVRELISLIKTQPGYAAMFSKSE